MELGGNPLQIFVSLFVVLAAIFVALVCDLLKGNIDQLRSLNLELRIRLDHERKRSEALLKEKEQVETHRAPLALPVAVPALVEVRTDRNPRHKRAEAKRNPAPEALQAMQRGLQMATMRVAPVTKREVAPEALADEHLAAPMPAAVSPSPERPTSSRDWGSLLERASTVPAPPPTHKLPKAV